MLNVQVEPMQPGASLTMSEENRSTPPILQYGTGRPDPPGTRRQLGLFEAIGGAALFLVIVAVMTLVFFVLVMIAVSAT